MKLTVNGTDHEVAVAGDMPLLWVLRDELHITGPKYGCGIAMCGACTVHVDGQPVRACVLPLAAVQGEVTTIEGLKDRGSQNGEAAPIEGLNDRGSQNGEAAPIEGTVGPGGLNGEATTIEEANGRGSVNDEATKIEAPNDPGTQASLNAVQSAWIKHQVAQCGYCQPGLIMTATALLAENPAPSDADIDRALAGHLCRCGTYPRIRRAIHAAAARLAGETR